jgi:hypothetical protein
LKCLTSFACTRNTTGVVSPLAWISLWL